MHRLDREIEPLRRRVGLGRIDDLGLAEHGRVALDQERRAGAAIDEDAVAEPQALARLQFKFESHQSRITIAHPWEG